MVKKELTNKKVVRAISLGLSAVMLATPMTALAAEGDVEDPTADTQDSESAQETKATLNEDSHVAMEKAEDILGDAKELIPEGGNIVDLLGASEVAMDSVDDSIDHLDDLNATAAEAANNNLSFDISFPPVFKPFF